MLDIKTPYPIEMKWLTDKRRCKVKPDFSDMRYQQVFIPTTLTLDIFSAKIERVISTSV